MKYGLILFSQAVRLKNNVVGDKEENNFYGMHGVLYCLRPFKT